MKKFLLPILCILLLIAGCSLNTNGLKNQETGKANIRVSYSGSKLIIDTDQNTWHNLYIKFEDSSLMNESIIDLHTGYYLKQDYYENCYTLWDKKGYTSIYNASVVSLGKSEHHEYDLSDLNIVITGVTTTERETQYGNLITRYLTINIKTAYKKSPVSISKTKIDMAPPAGTTNIEIWREVSYYDDLYLYGNLEFTEPCPDTLIIYDLFSCTNYIIYKIKFIKNNGTSETYTQTVDNTPNNLIGADYRLRPFSSNPILNGNTFSNSCLNDNSRYGFTTGIKVNARKENGNWLSNDYDLNDLTNEGTIDLTPLCQALNANINELTIRFEAWAESIETGYKISYKSVPVYYSDGTWY